MANTRLKNKPLSYFLAYGFAGGSLTGWRLRHLLKAEGYVMSRTMAQADIIIAHSAGCWELGNIKRARLVLMIGLPLAEPDFATTSYNTKQMYRTAIKNRHYLHALTTRLFGLFYIFAQPKKSYRIIRHIRRLQTDFVAPKGSQIVFITNQFDPWPTDDPMKKLADKTDWAFIGMPGSHDDIWEHPGRYLEVIKHYARILV